MKLKCQLLHNTGEYEEFIVGEMKIYHKEDGSKVRYNNTTDSFREIIYEYLRPRYKTKLYEDYELACIINEFVWSKKDLLSIKTSKAVLIMEKLNV